MTVRHATYTTRLLQIIAIATLGGIAYGAEHLTRHTESGIGMISAIGLLLICGTLAGELLEPFKIPHLTAYLAVGVVAGPYVLNVLDRATVDSLQTVNTLALALIAFAGGAELRLDLVKKSLRSLSASAFRASCVCH